MATESTARLSMLNDPLAMTSITAPVAPPPRMSVPITPSQPTATAAAAPPVSEPSPGRPEARTAVVSTSAVDGDGIRPLTLAPPDPGSDAGLVAPLASGIGHGDGMSGDCDGETYEITGIAVAPTPIYAGVATYFTALEAGDLSGERFEWTITHHDTGTVSGPSPSSGDQIDLAFDLVGTYTVAVLATATTWCGTVLQAQAEVQVGVAPFRVTGLEAERSEVAREGRVHFEAITDPEDHLDNTIHWEYRREGAATWTPIPEIDGRKETDLCFHNIGVYEVRASMTSGGVTTSQTRTVTVVPRPKAEADVDYYDHWPEAQPLAKWAEATLSVEHPAQGQRTCEPVATIELEITRAAGSDPGQYGEIAGFAFTLAGHNVGNPWENHVLDRPLQSDGGVPDPTYSVQFTVGLGSVNQVNQSFAFELYAEQPPNYDMWGETIPGRPSKQHGTMWKLSGTISWSIDDDGVFTNINVAGLSAEQATDIATNDPTIPIRSVDYS